VRMKGLEPPRLSALEPKSRASTNSATSALVRHSHAITFMSTPKPQTPCASAPSIPDAQCSRPFRLVPGFGEVESGAGVGGSGGDDISALGSHERSGR
jgi:hypothetical protein